MSRIDEAWKRTTGAAAEPRAPSVLERFALERAPRLEEANVANFVAPGPHAVRGKPSVPPQGPEISPAPAPPDREEPAVEGEPDVDTEKLVDFRQIANYVGFLARSVSRHVMLAAGTFSLALGLTVVTLAVMPKTYHAGSKLLALRNAVMANLSNPGRSIPWDADAPTRAAAETILRRDNLISLIAKNDVIAEWDRTRAPILKVKDALLGFVFRHTSTAEERLDQMVDQLSTSMVVVAGPLGDGTVTIDLDWPDAQMAYNLVQSAQQAFLVARQAAETAAINESIGILQNYSATLHTDVDRTMAELKATQASRRRAAGTAKSATASARQQVVPSLASLLPPVPEVALTVPALGPELDDPELPRLKAATAAKRQEIARLEDARQQQLSVLHGRLEQLMAVYTPNHPSVMTVQQNIAALSEESPQTTELKAAADGLEAEYQKRLAAVTELEREERLRVESARAGAAARAEQTSRLQQARTAAPAPEPEPPNPAGGDETDFASIRLRLELNQIMNVIERTDSARIELAVSEKAFKYRYTVVTPAQVPKGPVRPRAFRVLGAGLIASLLLALAAVLGKDLLSNRILELWQIERQLGLPVLGTLVNV